MQEVGRRQCRSEHARDSRTTEETPGVSGDDDRSLDHAALSAELTRVEGFIARARSLPTMPSAVVPGRHEGHLRPRRNGQASGKAVVFTESLTTQEYLRKLSSHGAARGTRSRSFAASTITKRAQRRSPVEEEEGARPLPDAGRAARSRSGSPWCMNSARARRCVTARSRREGPQSAVLRTSSTTTCPGTPRIEQRRALPPLQPAARRHRRQLHRQGQRGSQADLRDHEPEARPVRERCSMPPTTCCTNPAPTPPSSSPRCSGWDSRTIFATSTAAPTLDEMTANRRAPRQVRGAA